MTNRINGRASHALHIAVVKKQNEVRLLRNGELEALFDKRGWSALLLPYWRAIVRKTRDLNTIYGPAFFRDLRSGQPDPEVDSPAVIKFAAADFHTTFRINGRATQAEERLLKSIKYLMGDEEITPKKKYKEMKAIFDEHGRSAFDKDGKIFFDSLNAKFGRANDNTVFDNDNAVQKTAFDIKPSALAARDEAIADGDSSHNDDRNFDKEGSRTFELRPRPWPTVSTE